MRKIIVGAMVSMDGVMQAPGGPTEDPTKGFKFGGWDALFDQEFGEEPRLQGEVRSPPRPQDLRDLRRVLEVLLRKSAPRRHRETVQRNQEVRGFALRRGHTSWQG